MTTVPEENVAVETRLAVVEANTVALQEGQRQIIARLDSMEQANSERMDAMQRANDARTDAMQRANDERMDAMQRANNERMDAMQQANNARFDALNSRIDRLFYTILALGIGAIGTLIALDKIL